MFTTADPDALKTALDAIPLAMFAVERPGPDHAFRLLCLNRCHEEQSGHATVDVCGLRPADLLPPNEAEAVENRMGLCARHRKKIAYQETLKVKGERRRWRTVLHPIQMPNGHERVIGVAYALDEKGQAPAATWLVNSAMETHSRPSGDDAISSAPLTDGPSVQSATIVLGRIHGADVIPLIGSRVANNHRRRHSRA